MEHKEVIIIGGGLNGLGCAKHLQENHVPFRLITEDIGGRVKVSPDGQTNYGAYFVTGDSRMIMPYVEKVNMVHFAKAHFHRDGKQYRAYSFRMIKHVPAGVRLVVQLLIFRRHLRAMLKRASDESFHDLIEADPYLRKLYHQKAGDFIREHGLEKLTREYLEQFLWAAYFTDPREVSAAIFLAVLETIIVPSWSFKFHFEKLIAPFQDRIIIDSVTEVRRLADGRFVLATKSGNEFTCDILVLATPMSVTNTLVKPQKVKGGIDVHYYHLRGKIKKQYDVPWYSFFPIEDEAAISREPNGTYLYFYGRTDNVAKYFDQWEVIARGEWKPALFFFGDVYINEHPEQNLFLATDHTVVGTEEAFINGHYIASLVLKELADKKHHR